MRLFLRNCRRRFQEWRDRGALSPWACVLRVRQKYDVQAPHLEEWPWR